MNISCRIANADTQCGRITNPPERGVNTRNTLPADAQPGMTNKAELERILKNEKKK
jgi:hypothetical protein